jgi:lipopolysaccharide transport system ATP-binding protein
MDVLPGPFVSDDVGQATVAKFCFTFYIIGDENFLNIDCNLKIDGKDNSVDIRRSVARLKFSETLNSDGFVNLDIEHQTVEISSSPASAW